MNAPRLCRVIPFAAALPLLLGCGGTLAQSSGQQTPKKSSGAPSAALTPQEKEAQKHYRIALEAIKNNDLATASDELKTAADLAPKNALIWYNLAVVESEKGDSKLALDHLHKATSLGLPKGLQNDADQLEAKLSYDVKMDAKREVFSAKLTDLQKRINEGAVFDPKEHCKPDAADGYGFELQVPSSLRGSVTLKSLFGDQSGQIPHR